MHNGEKQAIVELAPGVELTVLKQAIVRVLTPRRRSSSTTTSSRRRPSPPRRRRRDRDRLRVRRPGAGRARGHPRLRAAPRRCRRTTSDVRLTFRSSARGHHQSTRSRTAAHPDHPLHRDRRTVRHHGPRGQLGPQAGPGPAGRHHHHPDRAQHHRLLARAPRASSRRARSSSSAWTPSASASPRSPRSATTRSPFWVPNVAPAQLQEMVGTTAQLYFRPVYTVARRRRRPRLPPRRSPVPRRRPSPVPSRRRVPRPSPRRPRRRPPRP